MRSFARATRCDTPAVAKLRPMSMNTKAIAKVPIAGLSSSRASITNTANENNWSPAACAIVHDDGAQRLPLQLLREGRGPGLSDRFRTLRHGELAKIEHGRFTKSPTSRGANKKAGPSAPIRDMSRRAALIPGRSIALGERPGHQLLNAVLRPLRGSAAPDRGSMKRNITFVAAAGLLALALAVGGAGENFPLSR